MEPGLQGTAQRAVDSDSTAKAMGSGSLDVLATPAMIALMEAAAVDAVKGKQWDRETLRRVVAREWAKKN